MHEIVETLDKNRTTMFMDVGLVILPTWLVEFGRVKITEPIVAIPKIWFTIARRVDRMMVSADITVWVLDDKVLNIDADTLWKRSGYVPSSTELWLLRLFSIADFLTSVLSGKHERRRLGNSGTGVVCVYPNGTVTILDVLHRRVCEEGLVIDFTYLRGIVAGIAPEVRRG